MKNLEILKYKIKERKIINSSEVLSWGKYPKSKNINQEQKTILEDSLVNKSQKNTKNNNCWEVLG